MSRVGKRYCLSSSRSPLYRPAPPAAWAACWGFTFLPSLLYLTLGGGARLRRPSRERTLFPVSLVTFEVIVVRQVVHTERSCREWRTRHSTATSSTSWARSIRQRLKRQRCHLNITLSACRTGHMTLRSAMIVTDRWTYG